MILLRSFLSGHIRIKRTLEYYDAGIGPRVPFGGGFGPTVSANFAVALGDFTTLSSTSTMPTGGSISRAGNAMLYDSTGKLTYAPNNLLLYSNDFTNGVWGKTAGGTGSIPVVTAGQTDPLNGTNASRLQLNRGAGNTSSDFSLIRQFVTSSATGVRSIWVKSNTGSNQTFALVVTNAASVVTATTSWTQVYYTSPLSSAGQFDIGSYGPVGTTASLDILVYSASVEAVTYETTPRSAYPVITTTSAYYGPRFDYDPRPSLAGTASITGSAVTLPAIFNDGTPASSIDSAYVGQTITVGGTGYPVTAYVGSTRIATVTGTPTSGSQSFTLTNPEYLLNRGLLVEGTRTNLSVAMSAFTTGNASFASTSAVNGPDGTTSAYVLNDQSATGVFHQLVSQPSGLTANAAYTASAFVKLNTSTSARYITLSNIGATSITGAYAVFDIQSGTVAGTGTGGSGGTVTGSGITPVGNGWYRVWISGVSSDTIRYFLICGASAGVYSPDGLGRQTYDGASRQWYIYGPQYEIGVFPSSHIPASLTRAAETFSLTGYANRLVEAFYIDEQTGGSYSGNSALSTGTVTISPPTFGWVTSLRAYTNAYAGSISSPSWLSFSRAGNATYYDSTGTLTWAPANLLTYSQDYRNTATAGSTRPWVWYSATVTSNVSGPTAPDGTATASKIVEASGTSITPRIDGGSLTVSGSITHIYSVYAQKGERNFIYIDAFYPGVSGYAAFFNLNTGTVGTVAAGISASITPVSGAAGWYRCTVIRTMAAAQTTTNFVVGVCAADNTPSYNGDGTSGAYIWGAQLERTTYATAPSAYIPTTSAAVYGPRYDYDPSTVPATPRGLLIEEQRANIALYSNATVADWTAVGASSFVNSGKISPDGATSMALFTEDTNTSDHRAYVTSNTNVLTANAPYTGSVYLAAGSRRYVVVSVGGAFHYFGVTVDTQTWTISGTHAVGNGVYLSSSITNNGNGIYRVFVTGLISSSGTAAYVVVGGSLTSAATSNNASYLGAGGTFYFWGTQVEAASFPSSYIPTTTASVARAADVAQLTGSALTTAGATTGSAIVQTTLWQNSTAAARDLLSSATTRRLLYSNSSNTVLSSTDGTTGLNATIGGSGTFTGGAVRSAISWDSGGRSLVANNGTLTSDAVNLSTGATATLGGYGTTTTFDGWIASMALYNQKLPDAILKQKSSVGAPY